MHIRSSISAVLALVLAAPALAQQPGSLSDFELPPEPDSTATPEVQGPVDPEAAVRTTPRVIPTDTPTPQASPSPVLTPAPVPSRAPTLSLPSPRPTPTRTPRVTRPTQTADAPQAAPTPTATVSPEPAASAPAPLPADIAPSAPPSPSAQAPEPADGGGSIAVWLAALLVALGLAGAAWWYFRRREENVAAPLIEPPLARRPEPRAADEQAPAEPEPSVPPPAKPVRRSPVTLDAQPVRLSRSMMNATFAFRVVLENEGTERWEDVSIEADLVTAHGAAPVADQVASPDVPLAPLHSAPALEAGQTIEFTGEVRLPLGEVRAIPQGRAAVYVPLLRLRVTAGRKQPLARTFLIGQLPDRQGGRLQPFRLDEMPQSYHAIGMRPLD